MKKIIMFALGAVALAGIASADIKPTLDSVSPTALLSGPLAGNYMWSYHIDVLSGESVNSTLVGTCVNPSSSCGTFFTIYDIPGLAMPNAAPPNPFQPSGWTSSIQLMGLTSSGVTSLFQADSPAISNVTWTYTGPPVSVPGPFTTPGFGFYSTSNISQIGLYSSQNTGLGGLTSAGQGRVLIPTGVPEPASMLLIGGGLVGLALLRRKLVR